MIQINLLPKEYRKRSAGGGISFGKTEMIGLAAVGAVLVLLFSVTFIQMGQMAELDDNIQRAQQRAAMLEKDIKLVDGLLDVKHKISLRLSAIEKLDSHRSAWVRILQDISATVPDFVWLGKVNEKPIETPKSGNDATQPGQKPNPATANAGQNAATSNSGVPTVREVSFEGYAFSLNALAKLMINMMNSEYFDEVELVSSEEVNFDKYKAYNFVVGANLHYLSDEESRNNIAQADEASDNGDADKAETSHRSLN
jgi:Tfp pilus assembly protein PilN